MSEKKHVYEAEVMALPPLRMVLGEVPSPDPEGRRKPNQQASQSHHEIESTVKRIIEHLENKK